MELETLLERYPRTIKLKDKTDIEIRLMRKKDRAAVLKFARSLPEEDVMFLRIDITQPDTVDGWLSDIEAGHVTSLAAYDGSKLVGYATVRRDPVPWTRRVGELRVNIAPSFRSKGLGRNLMSQIFDIGRSLGLRKIVAHMTDGQTGTRAVLQRLGFMPEALLTDYVEDREGNPRDLIVMTYDVDGLTDQIDEPLRV